MADAPVPVSEIRINGDTEQGVFKNVTDHFTQRRNVRTFTRQILSAQPQILNTIPIVISKIMPLSYANQLGIRGGLQFKNWKWLEATKGELVVKDAKDIIIHARVVDSVVEVLVDLTQIKNQDRNDMIMPHDFQVTQISSGRLEIFGEPMRLLRK